MKTALVTLLFLTLALNSFAGDIVGLKSNNPPLTGELAGVRECQIAEADEDGVSFTSFFYKQDVTGQKTEVYAVIKNESHRIKAFIEPKFTQPQISVINPPDKNLYNLTFDGNTNKDKSKVLDLSLKLCIAKQKENKLVEVNLYLQQQLVQAKQVVDKIPALLARSYQTGYISGLSENTMQSMILGRKIGQLEGLVVGYQKGVADALKVDEDAATATMVNVVGRWNSRSGSSYPYSDSNYDETSKVGFMSDKGKLTPANKDRVLRDSIQSKTEAARAEAQRNR